MNNRDRDYRPNRRRSFDDDNYEPPRRNFGFAPPSGPQFQTPSGPSVRASVKWYNPEKGFGFVQLADGSGDAFLHVSVVERGGHSSVPPGATLEVRTSPGPKGPQVTEIIISVDASTASQEPPRRPRPERPAYPTGDRATVEELGTVKWCPVDVLIIGAGASGAAVAWSLADTKMHILCLEQGAWMNPATYPSTGRDWEARFFGDYSPSPKNGADPDPLQGVYIRL
jgi:CspA family cold shock protein